MSKVTGRAKLLWEFGIAGTYRSFFFAQPFVYLVMGTPQPESKVTGFLERTRNTKNLYELGIREAKRKP